MHSAQSVLGTPVGFRLATPARARCDGGAAATGQRGAVFPSFHADDPAMSTMRRQSSRNGRGGSHAVLVELGRFLAVAYMASEPLIQREIVWWLIPNSREISVTVRLSSGKGV